MSRFGGILVENGSPAPIKKTGRFGGIPVEDEVQQGPQQSSRTIPEFGKDLAVSAFGGVNALLKTGGDLYGLATGDMDNMASRQGQSGMDYWAQHKSQGLKDAEVSRKQKIDAAEGVLNKAGTAFWETITSPALLSSFIAEQAPLLIPAAGAGRAAGMLTRAAGAGVETTAKVATGAAVGTGAAMQGTDAGSQAYQNLMSMPDEVWMANPEIKSAVESGKDFQSIKESMALQLSRESGIASGIVSVGLNMLPGATILEKSLAGVKLPGVSRAANAVKGFAGETVQEAGEEGFGAFASNVASKAIDPSVNVTSGVGEAAGLGAAGGIFGGVAGALKRPSSSDIEPEDIITEIGSAPDIDTAIQTAARILDDQPKSEMIDPAVLAVGNSKIEAAQFTPSRMPVSPAPFIPLPPVDQYQKTPDGMRVIDPETGESRLASQRDQEISELLRNNLPKEDAFSQAERDAEAKKQAELTAIERQSRNTPPVDLDREEAIVTAGAPSGPTVMEQAFKKAQKLVPQSAREKRGQNRQDMNKMEAYLKDRAKLPDLTTPIDVEARKALRDRINQSRDRYGKERAINPATDSILTAIAKLGGLSREAAAAEGIDQAEFNRLGWKIKRVFTAKGDTMDGLAERLAQYGYPVMNENGGYEGNILLDKVGQELAGNKVYSASAVEKTTAQSMENELDAQQQMQEQRSMEDMDAIFGIQRETDDTGAPLPFLEDEDYDGLDDHEDVHLGDISVYADSLGLPEDVTDTILERGAIQGLTNDEIKQQLIAAAGQAGERVGSPSAGLETGSQEQGSEAKLPESQGQVTGQFDPGTAREAPPEATTETTPQTPANAGVSASGDLFNQNTSTQQSIADVQREIDQKLGKGREQVPAESAGDLFDPNREKQGDLLDTAASSNTTSSEVEKPEAKVKLYRGSKNDSSQKTVGNALFYSPDKSVAEMYAGDGGKVTESQIEFTNLLSADTWMDAKKKVGLSQSDSMEKLVESAREQGYDGITFNTTNGKEYIHIPDETKNPEPPAAEPVAESKQETAASGDLSESELLQKGLARPGKNSRGKPTGLWEFRNRNGQYEPATKEQAIQRANWVLQGKSSVDGRPYTPPSTENKKQEEKNKTSLPELKTWDEMSEQERLDSATGAGMSNDEGSPNFISKRLAKLQWKDVPKDMRDKLRGSVAIPISEIQVDETYEVEGSGKEITVQRPATEALQEINERINGVKALIACLKGG